MDKMLWYIELSTQGKNGFYYLQKHKKICILTFNLVFENSTQNLIMYKILVKIIFFVYIKVTLTVVFFYYPLQLWGMS